MKKTVYVCGNDDYGSQCEINYTGTMLSVEGNDDEKLVGIDLMSLVEITGDMAEHFLKGGGARQDTQEALEDLVNASREYMRVVTRGKAVIK